MEWVLLYKIHHRHSMWQHIKKGNKKTKTDEPNSPLTSTEATATEITTEAIPTTPPRQAIVKKLFSCHNKSTGHYAHKDPCISNTVYFCNLGEIYTFQCNTSEFYNIERDRCEPMDCANNSIEFLSPTISTPAISTPAISTPLLPVTSLYLPTNCNNNSDGYYELGNCVNKYSVCTNKVHHFNHCLDGMAFFPIDPVGVCLNEECCRHLSLLKGKRSKRSLVSDVLKKIPRIKVNCTVHIES